MFKEKFIDKRGSRSSAYQWCINEVPVAHEVLDLYSNAQGYLGALNPFYYNERYFELKEALAKRTRDIFDAIATPYQKQVLTMHLDGYSQSEISKIFKCRQSNIHKCLFGNNTYDKGYGKVHGGIVKKIKKATDKDVEIKKILDEMSELLTETL